MVEPAASPPVRVALHSVGCKVNHYEVEALKSAFSRRGYHVVAPGDPADVHVINTCTVTGSGDADSRRAVRRARSASPGATIVATGCYAQRQPATLRRAGADLVVGNGRKADLLALLEAHQAGWEAPGFDPEVRPRTAAFLQIDGAVEGGRTRGALQIQDGCDEHCTYCLIPAVRGPGVSRPAAQVVEQARRMVDAGYRELALTGVHSGSYGVGGGRTGGLLDLLEELERVPGLARIRLNSIEPGFLSDALIDFVAGSGKVCRHFHLPLQSGDATVLRRMGRRYTPAHYAERVERAAARVPACAIGADVMVGFPGEGEAEFRNTMALLDGLPITYLHVFTYSPRPGTPATRLGRRAPAAVCRQRAGRLIRLGRARRMAFHSRFLGRTVEVLVEDHIDAASGLQVGLTDNYIRVLWAGPQAPPNRLLPVRLTHAREDAACGEAVESP
ncbi:MAG: tRNA (N(6)-L-threonylcarbamoyladenosine(37)-C(2))-methylthiotransferase MtaB [Candidatus Latescibacterota bacterium]